MGLVRSSLAPLPPHRLWDADPTLQVLVVTGRDETTGVRTGRWMGGALSRAGWFGVRGPRLCNWET